MASARTSAASSPIPSELEQAWLVQLVREHAQICHERRIKLAPPIIRLSRSSSRLGFWSGEKREICLSSLFIAENDWSVVLQVFKHEIAHQLCEELWYEPRAGHGESFRKACQVLGVDAPFQKAEIDLAEGLQEALHQQARQSNQEERLHQRIRKLLALAGSSNEHEAALALARAKALVSRHQLDTVALSEQSSFVHESINTGRQRMPRYRSAICSLLLEHFAVRVIIAGTYDQHRNLVLKTVELLGRSQDVAIARHCYHFLEERLATLWRAQGHRFSKRGRAARNSYLLGLVAGFREALKGEKQREQTHISAVQANALMLSEERLSNFVGERFPRLRSQRRQRLRLADVPYSAALQEGRKLRLTAPLSNSSPTTPAALPCPDPKDGDR